MGDKATPSRRRKTREVAVAGRPPEPTLTTAMELALPAATNVQGQQQQNRPFSHMSLLLGPENPQEEARFSPIPTDAITNLSAQMNHIITLHNENLKYAMGRILEKQKQAGEERAADKLREKNVELHQMQARITELETLVALHKGESERLRLWARSLERTTLALQEEVDAARRRQIELEQEEDAESSYEDPGRVCPLSLECKACERRLATVMLWPCRHVCVCTGCNPATRTCPVCHRFKRNSIEVHLPPN